MKDKKFDCVEMKNKIQQELLEEKKKYTSSEWQKICEKRIQQDPIIGPYLDRYTKLKNTKGLS
ncbi:MAG: hypothetical protein HQK53_15450 [Oligoflexia bacterium]|nr:hypothetical protein [Oligoflexia bacterium]